MTAKFSQNPDLASVLRSTGTTELGEATRDRYWGIGRALGDPSVFSKEGWKGRNKCGELLMEVRDELS